MRAAKLLHDALSGNSAALNDFVQEAYNPIVAIVKHQTPLLLPYQQEDVVQEIWLAILMGKGKSFDPLNPQHTVLAYIEGRLKNATRKILDAYRPPGVPTRTSYNPSKSISKISESILTNPCFENAILQALDLQFAMGKLPAYIHKLLRLYHWKGYSQSDIALAEGLSQQTVSRRLSKGQGILWMNLEEYSTLY